MRIQASVVVTTHENPKALDLVLAGLSSQRASDFEVLLADDGSSPATREVASSWEGKVGRRLVHAWQPHRGFRVAAARNRAIALAAGEAVLFLDGDSIPHPAWVGDHLALLRPGRFVQGHRVLLGPALTKQIARRDVEDGRLFRLPFLFAQARRGEVGNIHNSIRIPFLGGVPHAGAVEKGVRTANLSVPLAGLLTVNGFDEAYEGWGREDADLAVRLAHAGLGRVDARGRAIVFHLSHEIASREGLSANEARLVEAVAARRVRAVHGLTRGAS